ncbi:MAG: hypothetical protein GKC03_04340 [Methanomassiliicoccales archaeon]|nr:hypothetical protein [Methanomassiliicoccales archaeon]
MEYDIKRGHFKNIESDGLKDMLTEFFGGYQEDGDTLIANYGAMIEMRVKVLSKSSLVVETKTDTNVSDDVAMDTIRKFNKFLESATGLNSKQRRDRLSKKAKEGKL